MAITWKNIDSGLADTALAAARVTQNANAGIAQGIRGLAGNLEDYRTDKTDKNTSAYLDQLAGYGSAEELDAARQSGLLSNMRSGFGDFIDSGALRGAADTRRNELFAEQTATRNRANADYTYEQNEAEKGFRDLKDQFNALNVSDNDVERDALMNNPDFLKQAKNLGQVAYFRRAAKEQDEAEVEKSDQLREKERTLNLQTIADKDASYFRTAKPHQEQYSMLLAQNNFAEAEEYLKRPEVVEAFTNANLLDETINEGRAAKTSTNAFNRSEADRVKREYKARLAAATSTMVRDGNTLHKYRNEDPYKASSELMDKYYPDGNGLSEKMGSTITDLLVSGVPFINDRNEDDFYPIKKAQLATILRTDPGAILSGNHTAITAAAKKLVATQGYADQYKVFQNTNQISYEYNRNNLKLLGDEYAEQFDEDNGVGAAVSNASVDPLNQAGVVNTPQNVIPLAENEELQPDFPTPTKKETSKLAKNMERLAELESELEVSGELQRHMGSEWLYDPVISQKIRKQKLLIKDTKKRDEQRERKKAIKSGQYFGR